MKFQPRNCCHFIAHILHQKPKTKPHKKQQKTKTKNNKKKTATMFSICISLEIYLSD